MSKKKKIYGFNNGGARSFLQAVALGEDGSFLASHLCSSEGFMLHDLGVTSDWKHEIYNKHFGEGNWEIEFVPSGGIDSHEGLQKALQLNKTAGDSEHAEKASITLTYSDGCVDKVEVGL